MDSVMRIISYYYFLVFRWGGHVYPKLWDANIFKSTS
jgi:hypothetical protein